MLFPHLSIESSSQKVHSGESDLQSRLLLVGVDVGKAKHDACTTQCHFLKNEDVIEGLLIY